jgi:hypothetical protein
MGIGYSVWGGVDFWGGKKVFIFGEGMRSITEYNLV